MRTISVSSLVSAVSPGTTDTTASKAPLASAAAMMSGSMRRAGSSAHSLAA